MPTPPAGSSTHDQSVTLARQSPRHRNPKSTCTPPATLANLFRPAKGSVHLARIGSPFHVGTLVGPVAWRDDLRSRLPREEIPPFLADLQALVAALREDRPRSEWTDRLTPRLRAHPELVLGYLSPGPPRDAVAAELT